MQRLFIKSALLYCFLILLSGQSAVSQKNCHFVFKETFKINNDALGKFLATEKLKHNLEAGQTIDSVGGKEQWTIPEMVAVIDSGISDSDNYSMYEIFREGTFVINRDLKKPKDSTIIRKTNLLNCDLTVIDSFTYRKIDSVNVSFLSAGDQVKKYTISKTNEQKIIKGYPCEKIIITELSTMGNETERRYFEVWATRKNQARIARIWGTAFEPENSFGLYTTGIYRIN